MSPLLLSYRQTAKLLGLGRDRLRNLIDGGHITPVELFDEMKFPLEEVERFAREGTGIPQKTSRKPSTKKIKEANTLGEDIASIKL